MTTSLFKAITKLKKMNKHLKRNEKLNSYFETWLKDNYGCNNENEVINAMKNNPQLIVEMVDHYDNIKEEYK